MHQWTVTLTVILTAVLVHVVSHWYLVTKEHVPLVVLVSSARHNFDQRNAIRDTWMKDSVKNGRTRSRVLFLIGDKSCPIPPWNRVSQYSCHRAEKVQEKSLITSHSISASSSNNCVPISRGFSFQLNHDAEVREVGCLETSDTCSVELHEIYTKEIVLSETFGERDLSQVQGGYRFYKVRDSLTLHKGFTGLIVSEESDQNLCIHGSSQVRRNGVVTYHRLYNSVDEVGSRPFSPVEGSAVSIVFEVNPSQESLPNIQHQSYADKEVDGDEKLEQESRSKDDLLLVPVTDVYSNLPVKLLQGMSRVVSKYNFEYLIKTDDDSFLNLSLIHNQLESLDTISDIWWGNFRTHWIRTLYGKQADPEYESLTYPPFACGSGYLLSRSIVEWLDRNRFHLKMYQGEDTSLGIWLAAVNIQRKHDERWSCSRITTMDGMLSVPDLKTEEVLKVFKN